MHAVGRKTRRTDKRVLDRIQKQVAVLGVQSNACSYDIGKETRRVDRRVLRRIQGHVALHLGIAFQVMRRPGRT